MALRRSRICTVGAYVFWIVYLGALALTLTAIHQHVESILRFALDAAAGVIIWYLAIATYSRLCPKSAEVLDSGSSPFP